MITRLVRLIALSALVARTATAQDAPARHGQVFSIQPLGAMLTVYAGEFERAVSSTFTVGLGGTYWGPELGDGDFAYLSGDLKVRYYPGGRRLEGFSFGGTVGATRVSASDDNTQDSGSASGLTVGTMLDYGWLLGEDKRFYLGLGVGAKALFIGKETFSRDLTVRYPTARLSVGWAF